MARHTLIEWATHTLNLWWGCREVHCGCARCYARTFARRVGKGDAWQGVRYVVDSARENAPAWQRAAAKAGRIDRVFLGSMMDVFEESMPAVDWDGKPLPTSTGEVREAFLEEIVPATPNLLYLLLTKRPQDWRESVPASWPRDWPVNVMTGCSVSDQATADEFVPKLLEVPGPHFLSVEPLLGPIEFSDVSRRRDAVRQLGRKALGGIDWVIVGGESGPRARPMHLAWVRSLRAQCVAVGVPFFFKQWGEWAPDGQHPAWPKDAIGGRNAHEARVIDPDGRDITGSAFEDSSLDRPGCVVRKVGKKAAGRYLDGREWNEMPRVGQAVAS